MFLIKDQDSELYAFLKCICSNSPGMFFFNIILDLFQRVGCLYYNMKMRRQISASFKMSFWSVNMRPSDVSNLGMNLLR